MGYYKCFVELVLAGFASEQSGLTVHIDVLLLVRYLIESEMASVDGALIGSFPCVNAQVVEEVMPFPEDLPALAMLLGADEDTHSSTCVFVYELYLSEVGRAGNVNSAMELC